MGGRWRAPAVGIAGLALAAACTGTDPGTSGDQGRASTSTDPAPSSSTPTASATASVPSSSAPTRATAGAPTRPGPSSRPDPEPVRFDAERALRTVRVLAGRIGPREATSHRYARAAGFVAERLASYGYDVRRQRLRVPAGVSWGVPVPAGRTWNVVATPPGWTEGRRYVLVGAHLDTVPQAPGAEDNASGVAVLLELARMAAESPPRLAVTFVAFGAEEPRGSGDALHHFGSRALVQRMTPVQRRSLVAMVSLDRVGVGTVVPVCAGGLEDPVVRRALLRAARQAGVPASACVDRASDHWSFDRAGLPAARLGSTPYAGYHSAADLPRVVRPRQLERVGRVVWTWLAG